MPMPVNVNMSGIEIDFGNVYLFFHFSTMEWIICLTGRTREVTFRSKTGMLHIENFVKSDDSNVEYVNFERVS